MANSSSRESCDFTGAWGFGIDLQSALQMSSRRLPVVLLLVDHADKVMIGGIIGRFLKRLLKRHSYADRSRNSF